MQEEDGRKGPNVTTEVGVPSPGLHLPDGDFKDLIEFALQQ